MRITRLIPAKTFLLGEYIALRGGPAIVITTTPCFKLICTNTPGLQGIHPHSPAGRWWEAQLISQKVGLHWTDPYQGRGGLGASSAQFVGAYQAGLALRGEVFCSRRLLEAYLQYAWQGIGVPPSGYDVLAQCMRGPVTLIERQEEFLEAIDWSLRDIGFILIHTGHKLATHHHLETVQLPELDAMSELTAIARQAIEGLKKSDSQCVMESMKQYGDVLEQLGLVADSSVQLLNAIRCHPDVLAAKGCGAMGADVVVVFVPKARLETVIYTLKSQLTAKQVILATSNTLSKNETDSTSCLWI